jgi:ribosomal protein L20A (L18A)
MKFIISGIISLGKMKRKFKKEIEANSKVHAIDKLYALFGSANRLKRSQIKIEEIIGG